jgi:hypothetical protein
MVDCGATGLFLDHDFVKRNRITTHLLRHPLQLFNIDGTLNDQGSITHFARLELTVDEYTGWTDFLVCGLGGEDIILGLPWLREVNPLIDWRKGTLYAPRSQVVRSATIEEVPDEDSLPTSHGNPSGDAIIEEIGIDYDAHPLPVPPRSAPPSTPPEPTPPPPDPTPETDTDDGPPPLCRIRANRRIRRELYKQGILEDSTDQLWCAAGFTYSQQIAEQVQKDKPQRTFEEMVPPQYRQHASVFAYRNTAPGTMLLSLPLTHLPTYAPRSTPCRRTNRKNSTVSWMKT